MKFAFISTMQGWAWGGSEELWSQAAIHLKRAGHNVRASVVYRPVLSERLSGLTRMGIRVETQPCYLASPLRYAWERVSLATRRGFHRLRRFHPDLVIISQGHNAGGFEWANVCRLANIPYVIIIQCNNELLWFDDQTLTEALASYTAARKVFCVSQGNLDLLRRQLGESVSNGEIVWNPFNVTPEPAPAWPDESRGWRLACVARLDPAAKGQDLLLQAVAQPEWRGRRIELSLFGSGPHSLTLRRLAEKLNLRNVHFGGHVSDIRAVWEKNHLLVLPSRYEGLPLALVEAMWCGRPAVVTDVGGNAELCIDGETGFVAPAATVSSVNHALERAWNSRQEWSRLGQAAQSRVEALVPKDPVALFCQRLTACASRSNEAQAGEVLFAR